MPRFPARTLVLMTLALLAFAYMWWQTHRVTAPAPIELHLIDGGTP